MQSKIAASIPLALPANYPLVGLGMSALMFLNIWQSSRVGAARKMAGVSYPTMLVTEAEAKADRKKFIYNCTQRAHGNTLEQMPFVLSLTAFLGIFNPVLATASAVAFAFGRIFYTTQYSSGEPAYRTKGFALVQYPGLLGLVFGCLYYSATASLKHYTA